MQSPSTEYFSADMCEASTVPDPTFDGLDVAQTGQVYFLQRALYAPTGHREPKREVTLDIMILFQQIGSNETRHFGAQTHRLLSASSNIRYFAPKSGVEGAL